MKIWANPSSLGMIKPSLLLSPLTLRSEKVTHLCLVKEKKKITGIFKNKNRRSIQKRIICATSLKARKPEHPCSPNCRPPGAMLCSCSVGLTFSAELPWGAGGRGTVLQQGLPDVISHKPLSRAQDGSVLYALLLQIYAIRQLSSIEYAQLHRDHRG